MVLNTTTGRALLVRPIANQGEKMLNQAKQKPSEKPIRNPDMIRVCGRWQKKDYRPDDAEMQAWKIRCKDRGWDPKTGKPKVDPTAATNSKRG